MMRSGEQIAFDHAAALRDGDQAAADRLKQEEVGFVLMHTLARLSADEGSFVHGMALKGGALMLGEFGSPRYSGDLDFTKGRRAANVNLEHIRDDLERAGRPFNVRVTDTNRGRYSVVVTLSYQSQCTRGIQPAKAEISLREDPVGAIRDAIVDGERWGLAPFTIPALDVHDLVAEKIRTLAQRAQPRDLYDLWFYLVVQAVPLDARELRRALDSKFAITRFQRYRDGLWLNHITDIERSWQANLVVTIGGSDVPDFEDAKAAVSRALGRLHIR